MVKIVGQTKFFSRGKATSLREGKPVKLRIRIDLVSYLARAEGLGKYDKGVGLIQ